MSFANLNYKLGLKRQFKVEDDLNKYTCYNYDEMDRKMKMFGTKANRASKVCRKIAPGLVQKTIKKIGRDGKIYFEEIIEPIEDLSNLFYEEPLNREGLLKLDWASTPLYRHF